ncbi:MAG TPA: hypothetical protein VK176_08490 [Phycisphaerales bacterium]|nr:hypothetical protein [Phycisphaerales bacterium]
MSNRLSKLILRAGVLPLVAAGLLPLALADRAAAQTRVISRAVVGSPGMAGGGNQISTRSVEKYARILELTDDQRETVKSLHEGYQATYKAAADKLQKELEEIREAFEDSQDGSVFAERMPQAQKQFREASNKAEAEFFSDFKVVLNEQQGARWEKVERARRRETLLRGGSLSGDSVDLTEVVEGLKLTGTLEPIHEAVNQYEVDLDRVLQSKKSMMDKQSDIALNGILNIDDLRKRSDEMKEISGKIKQVNQDYARRIEQVLPDDVRPAFSAAVKRQTFPRVYKVSQVSRTMDAALKLSDLDSNQKESIRALKESYDRQVAPLNDAWAAEIEKDEMDPANMSFGDGTTSVRINTSGGGNDEDQSPLAKARKARRELDESIKERLMNTLNPAQREKLPKPGTAPGEGGEGDELLDDAGVVGGVIIAPR